MTDRRCELWDAATSAAVDRHSMDVVGIPSATLMERAALACSHELVALRQGAALPVVVVCGPGNNGADGHAIARQLHGWGVDVRVVLATAAHNEAVAQQRALARACGVVEQGLAAAPDRAIVVDACLGTGSRGAPRGDLAAALAGLRRIAGPRLAVDVPSGVDPDRGAVFDDAIVAAVTVTFGRSKPGLHVTPGRAHAGRVVVADIGLVSPVDLHTPWSLIDPAAARSDARPPAVVRHKGDRGHVVVRGGSTDTPGAVVLAAHAAFRAGAGLLSVATDDSAVRAAVIAALPEAMLLATSRLASHGADALIVGPGLTDAAELPRIAALWRSDPRPAVWDAGGLGAIDGPCDGAPRVITPHPGEAARLLARLGGDPTWTAARVQADRIAATGELCSRTGAVVLLKGEGTIVGDGDRVAIATVGGPALATAGSGDVLAGILGALLARGVDPWRAACAGAVVHALAGDVAARRTPATTASDLIDGLADALHGASIAPDPWPQWRPA